MVDGRVEPESPRSVSQERPRMENFNRHWVRGRRRPILTPRPFLQVHHSLVLPEPPWGAAVGFGQVTHGPGLNILIPTFQVHSTIYPLPLHLIKKKMLQAPSQSLLMWGKGHPKTHTVTNTRPLPCTYRYKYKFQTFISRLP